MKYILMVLAILLVLGVAAFLLPAIIGIVAGILIFKSGHFIWAIVCILGGILLNIGIIYGEFGEGTTGGYHYSYSDDCPNCGSGDTDGNHCYDCGEDF